jgi:hypothetical protein
VSDQGIYSGHSPNICLNTHVIIYLFSQRADVNECEVNVDLMTGTAFKDAMEFIHKIIPDDERLKKRSREDAPSNVKREQVKKR